MDEVRTRTKPISIEELASWIRENREEMNTALFVVDASVAAKWVLQGEPNQENAVKIKK
jgi:hypothetical protein